MLPARVIVNRRRLLLGATGAALLPWPRIALGQISPAEGEAVIEELVSDIWATLRTEGGLERVDQLLALMEARTDVALLSRLALGRHWNGLPEAARDDYQTLFRGVVIRSLARRLDGYAEAAAGPMEERFQIISSAPVGKRDVLVRSKVFPRNGQPIDLDWRLRPSERGLLVIDLIVEGASLLVSQRSEFAAVIERSNVDGLLAELRARAATPEADPSPS